MNLSRGRNELCLHGANQFILDQTTVITVKNRVSHTDASENTLLKQRPDCMFIFRRIRHLSERKKANPGGLSLTRSKDTTN